MSAPDPEGFSLLAKLLAAGAAAGSPIIWLWTKLDKKADKLTVGNTFQEVKGELSMQRAHIGKIFDQMRDMETRAADRHAELLEKIYEVSGRDR